MIKKLNDKSRQDSQMLCVPSRMVSRLPTPAPIAKSKITPK